MATSIYGRGRQPAAPEPHAALSSLCGGSLYGYAGEVSPDFLYNLNSSLALFLGQVC